MTDAAKVLYREKVTFNDFAHMTNYSSMPWVLIKCDLTEVNIDTIQNTDRILLDHCHLKPTEPPNVRRRAKQWSALAPLVFQFSGWQANALLSMMPDLSPQNSTYNMRSILWGRLYSFQQSRKIGLHLADWMKRGLVRTPCQHVPLGFRDPWASVTQHVSGSPTCVEVECPYRGLCWEFNPKSAYLAKKQEEEPPPPDDLRDLSRTANRGYPVWSGAPKELPGGCIARDNKEEISGITDADRIGMEAFHRPDKLEAIEEQIERLQKVAAGYRQGRAPRDIDPGHLHTWLKKPLGGS